MQKQFSIWRLLICLTVCAGLILGCFPQKAEALALETGLAIGAIACLILMTAGVVFNPRTVEDIQAIGHDFQTFMYEWGTSAEKLDEVEDWFSGLSIINPEGDDGDDRYGRTTINLARGLLAGISLWIASIALNKHQPRLPSDSIALTDFAPVCYFSTSSHNYWYSPLQEPLGISDDFGGYFDGTILLNPTDKSLNSSVVYMLGPLRLSEGSYRLADNSYTLYHPGNVTSGSYNFSMLVYDVYDSEYSISTSKTVRYSTSAHGSTYDLKSACSFNALSDHDYYISVAYRGKCELLNDFVGVVFAQPLSLISMEYSSDPVFVGDVQSDLESGAISEEEVPLYNLNYADVLPQGKPVLEGIQDLSAKLASGELTVEEYLEMGHATVSGASEPVFTEDLDFEWFPSYYVGETPPVYSVDVISPDGGTIFYQWHLSGGDNSDFIITEYSSEESAKSFTVPLDTPGIYHLWCMAENRVYSDTLGEYEYFVAWKASSVASLRVLESDVNVDPDPGVDPDPDPDVNQDLADKVSSAVGDALKDAAAKDESKISSTGNDVSQQLLNAIPDYSSRFLPAVRNLSDALGYTGTSCVLTMPAITVPAVSDLFSETRILDEQQINFEDFFNKMPEVLLKITRALFDIAVVFFCLREFNHTIQQVMTGFKTPGDHWEEV